MTSWGSWTLGFLAIVVYFVATISAQDYDEQILGCGGFVKASADLSKLLTKKMDYSQIKVKLTTPDGVLKETTEVAPSSYYFLPISKEDRGRRFILRLEGPSGWSFEPAQAQVQIGDQGQCNSPQQTEGGDINFYFTGFGITGKVAGENCPASETRGPEGVTVALTAQDATLPIASVLTDASGRYTFANVFPGKYNIQASHQSWGFEKDRTSISMEWGNHQVKENLLVSGFDVTGTVKTFQQEGETSSEAVLGVDVLLYSDTVKKVNCPPVTTKGNDENKKPLCGARSDEKGRYAFQNIPCGTYTLVPFYRGANTTFEVIPTSKTITIDVGSLQVDQPFQVVGFSVSGRVLDFEGVGIKGVSIKVDGKERAQTDASGLYKLDGLKSGTYKIEATKERTVFNSLTDHRISPNSAVLPPISVKSFDLCGRIVLSDPPAGIDPSRSRTIVLRDEKGRQIAETTTDPSNQYCFQVAPGKYKLSPSISSHETAAGLSLIPSTLDVTVSNSPVLDLLFAQARVSVGGRVKCIETPCQSGITVTLTSKGDTQAPVTSSLVSDKFLMKDVLPGTYTITVNKESWCWEKPELDVEVKAEDVNGLEFVQTGYLLVSKVSHDVTLHSQLESKADTKENYSLSKGTDKLCLKKPGVYTLTPKSCYKFDQDVYQFDTNSPRLLELTAREFLVKGTVKTDAKDPQITVVASNNGVPREAQLTPLSANEYEYSVWSRVGDSFEFIPTSEKLLFYPRSRSVQISTPECPATLETIEGRPGLFIEGKIDGGADVQVTAYSTDDNEAVASIQTGKDGKYKIGPLYDDVEYQIVANKEGYNFEETTARNFKAFKLAKLTIAVLDQAKKAVPRVLLSLSGENFRTNNITNANGELNIYNLVPGEYFVRPMLKEYNFEPSSKTITVEQGQDHRADFVAKRVAFSCYGSLISLNGEPEGLVTVEAVGPDGTREETQADANGQFRIKGLAPGKQYQISVKPDGDIERASPAKIPIQMRGDDATGLEFVVFRAPNKHDVSGTVTTAAKWLSSLEVSICREEDPKFALQTVSLGPSNYFDFQTLPKGRYVARLKSNLSPQIYSDLEQEKIVDVRGSSAHVAFNFEPSLNQETMEVNTSPFLAILAVVGLAFLAYSFPKTVSSTYQSILDGSLIKNLKNSRRPPVAVDPSLDSWIPKRLTSPKTTKKNNK
eukprot:TRINITY_DN2361_c0_g1_i6.p1 TRINITY_DN2361_c0_g1~~TRINITY_DN2361_c0_g1_i6.p1  ORF type:complete len:1184 (-),score=357.86 TRINITY_DN2361_c0_g1_i6:30-3581(-)